MSVHHISKIRLSDRWSRPDAISFVRLSLHAALKEARNRVNQRVNDEFDNWSKIDDLACKAAHPLQRLIDHLSPDGAPSVRLMDGYGRIKAGILIKGADGKPVGGHAAKTQLDLFTNSLASIQDLIRLAKTRAACSPRLKGNETEHDKHGFVFRLAEAWIFLTGKPPGRGKVSNPFLDFVTDASFDGGVPHADYYSALVSSLEHLDALDRYDPDGKSRQSIKGIAKRGPEWSR